MPRRPIGALGDPTARTSAFFLHAVQSLWGRRPGVTGLNETDSWWVVYSQVHLSDVSSSHVVAALSSISHAFHHCKMSSLVALQVAMTAFGASSDDIMTNLSFQCPPRAFLLTWITLIPKCISIYIQYVWDESIHPFQTSMTQPLSLAKDG